MVMVMFGKFGACTARAVWLVEGFRSAGGGVKRLDRAVYACDRHLMSARVLWLQGLAADSRPAPGIHWCGMFTDYDCSQ